MSLEEQREEVQRVLHSTQFRRAPKLRRFLSLVCEYHFTNRSRDINEFLIASEAFGKGQDFDPSQDSLVRVQAREARRRLREYYLGDGKDSKVILDIPIGSYAPVFSAVNGASPPRAELPPKRVNPLNAAWLMLLVTALVCAALLFSAERQRRLWSVAASAAPAQAGRNAPALGSRLWDRFFDSGVPTVLVVSNPSVAGECIANPAAATGISGASAEAANCPDEYTGMGEAVAINLISNLFEARNKPLIVKQSRMVNEDDVKRYNLVLLGGRMVNNWTMRLGGDLSLTPGPGDVPVGNGAASVARYQTIFDAKTRQLISDRGMIALRRYPATGHWLLFLFGKHTQGTHAAAEGATDERFLARLRWPSKGGAVPDSFRVFVGVAVTDGIPGAPVPVALGTP